MLKQRSHGSYVLGIHLTLVPGRDDEIIAALQEVVPGALASAVREMMRHGVQDSQAQATQDEQILNLEGLALDL